MWLRIRAHALLLLSGYVKIIYSIYYEVRANLVLQVFMTQRATIQCVHEPFGDAWYYGPERLADRFEDDEQGRRDSGFSNSTYRTVMDRLEREGSEVRPFSLP